MRNTARLISALLLCGLFFGGMPQKYSKNAAFPERRRMIRSTCAEADTISQFQTKQTG